MQNGWQKCQEDAEKDVMLNHSIGCSYNIVCYANEHLDCITEPDVVAYISIGSSVECYKIFENQRYSAYSPLKNQQF